MGDCRTDAINFRKIKLSEKLLNSIELRHTLRFKLLIPNTAGYMRAEKLRKFPLQSTALVMLECF